MATKVTIEPGICRLTCKVETELLDEDEMELAVDVHTGCQAISGMFEALGREFCAFDVCTQKPGAGPFYDYIREHKYPVHASCPVICGIIKAMEIEAKLALPHDASITIEK